MNDNFETQSNALDKILESFDALAEHVESLNVKLKDYKQKYDRDRSITIEDEEGVDWMLISMKHNLSIPFLQQFRHKVYWEEISKRDYINEDYIRTFKDELWWGVLAKHHELSEDIKKEFAYKFE